MKRSLVNIAALVFSMALIDVTSAIAACVCLPGEASTSGGKASGVLVRERYTQKQTKYPEGATDLHFKLWQKEDNINVKGWKVCISDFLNATSQRGNQPEPAHSTLQNMGGIPPTTDKDNGQHAVDINAIAPTSGTIAHNAVVNIEACFWLTDHNTKRIAEVNWTKDAGSQKAFPNFGWSIGFPQITASGAILHPIIIYNDDPSDQIMIYSLQLYPSYGFYDSLSVVPFGPSVSIANPYLSPGDSLVIDYTTTDASYIGGHIYGKLIVSAGTADTVIDIFDHPVKIPGRVPSLTGWGLLVLLVLIMATGIWIYYAKKGKASLNA